MRVCVYIDGSNLYHGCKSNLGGRTDVNLGSFANFLVGPGRDLVRTYHYAAPLPPDHSQAERLSQQKFFSAIQRIPYMELRLGTLAKRQIECKACGDKRTTYQEKGVDMRVGVDMLAGASKGLYDVAILVTGDADLVEAVKAVKDLGKHVELASFANTRAEALAAVADVVITLGAADMMPLLLRQTP